jgi:hypothetical protein
MTKILIISIGAIIGIPLLIFVAFVLFHSWQARKHPPSYGIIDQKYYVCRKYQILEGGIYGKALLLKFPENNSELWCWRHEWEEIDRETFKKLATEWYEKDWSKENGFWSD